MNRYRDIIALPRPAPQNHARMPARNRAAQFAPFAALTGFDGVIADAAQTNLEQFEPTGEADEQNSHTSEDR